MKIAHLALWVTDIEKSKEFYEKYFAARSGDRYENKTKGFTSYFLSFPESEVRLEIMNKVSITEKNTQEKLGWAHLAMSVGSEETVNSLTEKLRADQVEIVGEPRWTGDGYYESVVKDTEGNLVEITI
ncbi:VOC family protein [Lacticigenium naphthae]|uniref:VOC family protein n=1 Tax=Lacticigenium naphthae TaxID=515351 RepID=UPI000422650A|nr:VOC family protein [Lacticigenium naphthae]